MNPEDPEAMSYSETTSPIKLAGENPLNSSPTDHAGLMTFEDGKLSARIISVSQDQAIEEFAQLTGVEVLRMGHEEDRPISVEFSELPINDAAQQILQGKNYTLLYTPTEEGERLAKILILSPGIEGEQEQPIQPLEEVAGDPSI